MMNENNTNNNSDSYQRKNFNPFKGGEDVQISQKKVVASQLRRLNSDALESRLSVPALEGILASHRSILASSYFLYGNIHLNIDNCDSPLWIRLLRNESGSRKFSNEITRSLESQFSRIDISWYDQFNSHHSNEYGQFRLGLYQNVLLSNASELVTKKLECLSSDQSFSPKQDSTFLDSKESRASLLSFCVANELVQNNDLETILLELSELLPKERITFGNFQDAELCFWIKVLNAMNLIHFKLQSFESVLRNISLASSKIESIGNRALRDHLSGIHSFHASLVEKANGNTEKELHHLYKAAERDSGYFDYHYRIASILHDRGSVGASLEYEKALKYGPLHNSIVNDFGCFIQETNDLKSLESWEKVNIFLGHTCEE